MTRFNNELDNYLETWEPNNLLATKLSISIFLTQVIFK